MNVSNDFKIGGYASISILDSNGVEKEFIDEENKIKSGDVIKNAILDSFFEKVLSGSTLGRTAVLKVGTGTSEVDLTLDTLESPYTLESGHWPYETIPTTSRFVDGDDLVLSAQYNFLFNIGQISGNISELGVYYAAKTSASPSSDYYNNFRGDHDVHTRLLIKDAAGNPTTITVLPSEQLKVSYTLYGKIPDQPVVQNTTIAIDGVDTPISITRSRLGRPVFSSLFNYFLGESTQTSARNYYVCNSTVGPNGSEPGSYVDDDDKYSSSGYGVEDNFKYYDLTWGSSDGNFPEGIKGVIPYKWGDQYYMLFKWEFSEFIPKDSTKRFKLRIKTTYSRA